MTEVSPSLSVITLNVSRLNSPMKRQIGRLEKKHMAQLYKGLTWNSKTQTGWKWKDGKRYSVQIVNKREQDWLYKYQTK